MISQGWDRSFGAGFVLIFILLIVPIYAHAEGMDGFTWEKSDDLTKVAFIRGFLHGYAVGHIDGHRDGSNDFMFFLVDQAPEEERTKTFSKNILTMGKFLEVNKEIRTSVNIFKKDLLSYVKELDAFYQTFPLCKSKVVDNLMYQFISVWKKESHKRGLDKEVTYKTIGESCLN